ncbi:MAG: 3-isopropylmalate dehydratase small subunit [Myxococcota bacterium]
MSFSTIRSHVVPLLVDHIDTDQIIPARYLKTVDQDGLGQHLFADWRKNGDFVIDKPEHKGAQVLLSGTNFGCGSSREHAAWALMGAGFRAVIAPSFGDIFRANALRNGLLPVKLSPKECSSVADAPATTIEIDLADQCVQVDDATYRFEIDAFAKECLLQGIDPLEYVLKHLDDIQHHERKYYG